MWNLSIDLRVNYGIKKLTAQKKNQPKGTWTHYLSLIKLKIVSNLRVIINFSLQIQTNIFKLKKNHYH